VRNGRLAALAVMVMTGVMLVASPAWARPDPEPAPSPRTPLIAPAYATAPCDPNGTTQADANLATTLNAKLQADMRGYMDAYRTSCARMVVQAVRARGLHPRAAVIAITTIIVETHVQNISVEVDHDSLGLFQQRASWGTREQRLDATWATNAFVNKMLSLYPDGSWMNTEIGVVCQRVQVSAYPDRYQPQAGDAQIIVDALWTAPRFVEQSEFADVDGDGRADLVGISGVNNDLTAYRNQGWGSPSLVVGWDRRALVSGFGDASRTTFADIDGDGRADLIGISGPNNDLTAYRNQGWNGPNGVFVGWDRKHIVSGFGELAGLKFADVDGDGRADLIATTGVNNDVTAYRNQGWGAASLIVGGDRKHVVSGFGELWPLKFVDADGDGRADLIATTGVNNDMTAYRNQGWDADSLIVGGDRNHVASGFQP
jgi:FG-GAP-like repeat